MATIGGVLGRVGPEREGDWRANAGWLRTLVLVHVAVRSILTFGHGLDAGWMPGPALSVLRVAVIVVAVAGWFRPLALPATRLALVLIGLEVAATVPYTANHVFLELLLLGFFALLDERREGEDELLLQGIRWLVVLFFAATGIQKALYGTYFDGQFLAWMAGTEHRFELFFRHLVPPDEMARLLSYRDHEVRAGVFEPTLGAGPYRVDSVLFVALSNLVWVFEIAAGLALLTRRLRPWAAVSGILFVVFIELAARELTFGLLMTNLFLFALPGAWVKRLFWLSAAGYGWLVAAHLLGLPMFLYSPA